MGYKIGDKGWRRDYGYNPIFEVQTLTYLRLTSLKLALVINFDERRATDGIHRVVSNL